MHHCQILTIAEEELLVRYLELKNQSMQIVSRPIVDKIIIQLLKLRQINSKNRTCKTNNVALSKNARYVLAKGKLGETFWQRFESAHPEVTIKRAVSCTRDMAVCHFDDLVSTLIKVGIFINARQISQGVWEGQIDVMDADLLKLMR